MRLLLATNHPEIDRLVEKLESEKGIKELEKMLKIEGLSQWARPLLIADQVLYRERLLEKAKAAQPDVIILYDKLPGAVEMEVILEEIRLEAKNSAGQDSRVIFLTSLEQGSSLLKKAVEMGIWDIISGQDIYPVDIIKKIYNPSNFSEVARFKLAPETRHNIKRMPAVQPPAVEKVVEKEVEKLVIREIKEVKRQSVITWWSASGGEGKTTLAASQAYQLAQITGEKVALLDFKEANPACSYWFNITPRDNLEIIDAIEKGSLNQSILEEQMAPCPRLNNLKIFTGVDLYRINSYSPEYFDAIINLLKYPYVVIDTNPGLFFSSTVSALQGADTVGVVVEPTYKSIEESLRWIDFVKGKWGVPAESIKIYFNKLSFRSLDADTLSKAFCRYRLGGFYKYSDSVVEALNKGRPVVKGFESLVDDMIFSEKKRKSLWAFSGRR